MGQFVYKYFEFWEKKKEKVVGSFIYQTCRAWVHVYGSPFENRVKKKQWVSIHILYLLIIINNPL